MVIVRYLDLDADPRLQVRVAGNRASEKAFRTLTEATAWMNARVRAGGLVFEYEVLDATAYENRFWEAHYEGAEQS